MDGRRTLEECKGLGPVTLKINCPRRPSQLRFRACEVSILGSCLTPLRQDWASGGARRKPEDSFHIASSNTLFHRTLWCKMFVRTFVAVWAEKPLKTCRTVEPEDGDSRPRVSESRSRCGLCPSPCHCCALLVRPLFACTPRPAKTKWCSFCSVHLVGFLRCS
jgi:hypothetical protein